MLNTNDETEMPRSWYPYDNGRSEGRPGWENGVILRDEELGDPEDPEDADARVTLERMTDSAKTGAAEFVTTYNLYGFLQRSFVFADEAAARSAFDEMRAAMERMTAHIPYEDDTPSQIDQKRQALETAARDLDAQLNARSSTGGSH